MYLNMCQPQPSFGSSQSFFFIYLKVFKSFSAFGLKSLILFKDALEKYLKSIMQNNWKNKQKWYK